MLAALITLLLAALNMYVLCIHLHTQPSLIHLLTEHGMCQQLVKLHWCI
jgi:hypothetical protein